jgi:hypothetical protein
MNDLLMGFGVGVGVAVALTGAVAFRRRGH